MMTNPPETSEEIATKIAEESPRLAKLVVLAVRKDGSSFSLDNGLTADEAKTMSVHFTAWLDKFSGQASEEN